MSNSIRNIMAKAYKSVLSNPREAKFAFRMQTLFQKSEKRRRKMLEQEGLEVPPFLISSISTTCNLHCKGCYARSNGIAEDEKANQKATLAPEQWQTIFNEAADMGINFSLIAGGEPFMRKDILEKIAEVKDMIFPIFTNGTLIGPSYMKFLKAHLNMVPIISIEGTAMGTDERRGKGVFKRAMQSMELLKEEDLFFGTSITVTTENYHLVTSPQFIDTLRGYGCKLVFYVEYVPTEAGTEHLAFGDKEVAEMERCWRSVAMPMTTLSSCRSLATRKPSAVAWPQVADSSTSALTVRLSPVRSRLSATAMWPRWAFARPYSRPCSARFVLPGLSAGNTLAAAHSSSTGKKLRK